MRSPSLSKSHFFKWADARWSRTATNEANPYEVGRWIALCGNLSCYVIAFVSGKSDDVVRIWADGLPTAKALEFREEILQQYHNDRDATGRTRACLPRPLNVARPRRFGGTMANSPPGRRRATPLPSRAGARRSAHG